MDLQTFLLYAVITILMTPLLLFYAIPFIAAARLLHGWSVLWLAERPRFVLACGVAALGIAPAYDDYRHPTPVWWLWAQGEPVAAGAAALSFLITWALVLLQLKTLMRHRAH